MAHKCQNKAAKPGTRGGGEVGSWGELLLHIAFRRRTQRAEVAAWDSRTTLDPRVSPLHFASPCLMTRAVRYLGLGF